MVELKAEFVRRVGHDHLETAPEAMFAGFQRLRGLSGHVRLSDVLTESDGLRQRTTATFANIPPERAGTFRAMLVEGFEGVTLLD